MYFDLSGLSPPGLIQHRDEISYCAIIDDLCEYLWITMQTQNIAVCRWYISLFSDI